MIILDTNVISEPYRPAPNLAVRAWLDAQAGDSLFLCTPVLAELQFGIERLPAGARKTRLSAALGDMEIGLFRDRILVLDREAATEYARVMAKRERIGRRISQMDGLIAAIALTHRAIVATRDIADFADLGLELINPFEA
jgi:predicted nucleic acid-binding protein